MKPLKLLCSADWHLDSPFRSLNSEQAALLRRRAREIPAELARLARELEADMLLLGGDLFDSGAPYLESSRALEQAFEDLDLPVFISPGNHDWCAPDSPWEHLVLPEHVHVFRKNRLERVSTPWADVYGAAFTRPESGGLLPGFAAARTPGKYNLLLLHADLFGDSRYCPIRPEELARSGLDLAVLGHIHRPMAPRKLGGVWTCYPGCPMGRGFDECGPRGAMLVTLTETGCTGELIELAFPRYETIPVPVTGRDPYEALAQAVSAARPGDICRFVLTGEAGQLPGAAALEPLARRRGLGAAFLRSEALPAPSDGGTLRSSLIDLTRERMDAAGTDERQAIAEALQWALAALDGAEAPWEVCR